MIVFLDFDGVISSVRAFIVNEGKPHDERWIDPISTGLIAKLAIKHPFQIVVSSTWRLFGRDRVAAALAPSGLDKLLHDDWRTNESPDGSRPAEIDDWLERNGDPAFVIVDDDHFAWTGRQLARWVRCHCDDGLTFEAYKQLEWHLTPEGERE